MDRVNLVQALDEVLRSSERREQDYLEQIFRLQSELEHAWNERDLAVHQLEQVTRQAADGASDEPVPSIKPSSGQLSHPAPSPSHSPAPGATAAAAPLDAAGDQAMANNADKAQFYRAKYRKYKAMYERLQRQHGNSSDAADPQTPAVPPVRPQAAQHTSIPVNADKVPGRSPVARSLPVLTPPDFSQPPGIVQALRSHQLLPPTEDPALIMPTPSHHINPTHSTQPSQPRQAAAPAEHQAPGVVTLCDAGAQPGLMQVHQAADSNTPHTDGAHTSRGHTAATATLCAELQHTTHTGTTYRSPVPPQHLSSSPSPALHMPPPAPPHPATSTQTCQPAPNAATAAGGWQDAGAQQGCSFTGEAQLAHHSTPSRPDLPMSYAHAPPTSATTSLHQPVPGLRLTPLAVSHGHGFSFAVPDVLPGTCLEEEAASHGAGGWVGPAAPALSGPCPRFLPDVLPGTCLEGDNYLDAQQLVAQHHLSGPHPASVAAAAAEPSAAPAETGKLPPSCRGLSSSPVLLVPETALETATGSPAVISLAVQSPDDAGQALSPAQPAPAQPAPAQPAPDPAAAHVVNRSEPPAIQLSFDAVLAPAGGGGGGGGSDGSTPNAGQPLINLGAMQGGGTTEAGQQPADQQLTVLVDVPGGSGSHAGDVAGDAAGDAAQLDKDKDKDVCVIVLISPSPAKPPANAEVVQCRQAGGPIPVSFTDNERHADAAPPAQQQHLTRDALTSGEGADPAAGHAATSREGDLQGQSSVKTPSLRVAAETPLRTLSACQPTPEVRLQQLHRHSTPADAAETAHIGHVQPSLNKPAASPSLLSLSGRLKPGGRLATQLSPSPSKHVSKHKHKTSHNPRGAEHHGAVSSTCRPAVGAGMGAGMSMSPAWKQARSKGSSSSSRGAAGQHDASGGGSSQLRSQQGGSVKGQQGRSQKQSCIFKYHGYMRNPTPTAELSSSEEETEEGVRSREQQAGGERRAPVLTPHTSGTRQGAGTQQADAKQLPMKRPRLAANVCPVEASGPGDQPTLPAGKHTPPGSIQRDAALEGAGSAADVGQEQAGVQAAQGAVLPGKGFRHGSKKRAQLARQALEQTGAGQPAQDLPTEAVPGAGLSDAVVPAGVGAGPEPACADSHDRVPSAQQQPAASDAMAVAGECGSRPQGPAAAVEGSTGAKQQGGEGQEQMSSRLCGAQLKSSSGSPKWRSKKPQGVSKVRKHGDGPPAAGEGEQGGGGEGEAAHARKRRQLSWDDDMPPSPPVRLVAQQPSALPAPLPAPAAPKLKASAEVMQGRAGAPAGGSANKGPELKEVKYAEVVRGKAARQALNGYSCDSCRAFYQAMAAYPQPPELWDVLVPGCRHALAGVAAGGAPQAQALEQALIQATSRHRARYVPPSSTPDGFWHLGFKDD